MESTGFDLVQLIKLHQAGIWRYLRALGCEATLAEDLTQDTFLAVLQKPFDDYSPAATASYLRRVAHNLFITAQRRSGRVTTVENIEEFDGAWAEWIPDDNGESMLEVLRECLQQLTERARLALTMRFKDRDSRADIAGALQITEHGAKNLMQRAKKQLRTCVEGKLE